MANFIGKTMYSVAYQKLLPTIFTEEDFTDYHKVDKEYDKSVSNFTPLKIVDAKQLPRINGVVIKVELPNKENRIMFGCLEEYNVPQLYKRTTLQRMEISALEQLPPYSAKILDTIRKSEIIKGMPEDALYMSWGYPKKSNDYGASGRQHIYAAGYVYVNINKKITDWQLLD